MERIIMVVRAPALAGRATPDGADIHGARTATDGFLATPAGDRRDFAVHVLMKVRANA